MLKKAVSILLVAILSINIILIAGVVELEASHKNTGEGCGGTPAENTDFTADEVETYSDMQMEEVGIQFDGDIYQALDPMDLCV